MTTDAAYQPTAPLARAEAAAIGRALRRVRRSSPLRPIAEEILAGVTPGPEEASTVLQAIGGATKWTRMERLLAVQCGGLVPLSSTEVAIAGAQLAEILDKRPKRSSGCLLASGCVLTYFGLLWIAWVAIADRAKNEPRVAAAVTLGRFGRPQSADALCRAIDPEGTDYAFGDKPVRRAAAIALASVAPNMQDGGCGRIRSGVIRRLCRMMPGADAELLAALIECMRQFGDGEAIRSVERAAAGTADPEIHSLADATLEVLHERARHQADRERLLRPSAAPAADPDRLLRPVETAPQASPDRLLRPSDPPEPEPEP